MLIAEKFSPLYDKNIVIKNYGKINKKRPKESNKHKKTWKILQKFTQKKIVKLSIDICCKNQQKHVVTYKYLLLSVKAMFYSTY